MLSYVQVDSGAGYLVLASVKRVWLSHHVAPSVAQAVVDGPQGRAHAGRGLGRGTEQKQA